MWNKLVFIHARLKCIQLLEAIKMHWKFGRYVWNRCSTSIRYYFINWSFQFALSQQPTSNNNDWKGRLSYWLYTIDVNTLAIASLATCLYSIQMKQLMKLFAWQPPHARSNVNRADWIIYKLNSWIKSVMIRIKFSDVKSNPFKMKRDWRFIQTRKTWKYSEF